MVALRGAFLENYSSMRAFIAIDFDESIRRKLAGLQDTLRRRAGRLSWVAPDNLHLTIKFLGEIDACRVETISAALDQIAARIEPFEIMLRGVGVFPPRGLAHVLWAGVQPIVAGAHDPLKALHRASEDGLADLGIAREDRPFSPHLTLARNKSSVDRDLRRSLEHGAEFAAGPQRINAVTFYESQLGASGPTYRVISTHRLASKE